MNSFKEEYNCGIKQTSEDLIINENEGKDFTLLMIKEVLKYLSNRDHFFVSEAHLQTEFIIACAKFYPNFEYYPEIVPSKVPSSYRDKYGDKGIHFDLLIKTKAQKVLIEFKYLTAPYEEKIVDVNQIVKPHLGVHARCYDSWLDIERIESFVLSSESDVDYGYFILITNAPIYWKNSKNDSKYSQFRINEGNHKKGLKCWNGETSKSNMKKRNKPIEIKQNYYFKYETFYKTNKINGLFKSLVVNIEKGNKGV